MSDLRCTAIHEAGHAVMAYRLDLQIHSISLIPTVVDGALRNGGTHIYGAIESKAHATETALCSLAAFPACVAAGVDGWLGRQEDMDGALQALWKWFDDAPAVYKECEARADAMMNESKNKAAVERLAALLLERKIINGADVRDCIAQSDRDIRR